MSGDDHKTARRNFLRTATLGVGAAAATGFKNSTGAQELSVGSSSFGKGNLTLTNEQAKGLLGSLDHESQDRLLNVLRTDGMIAKCHWLCGSVAHGDLPSHHESGLLEPMAPPEK